MTDIIREIPIHDDADRHRLIQRLGALMTPTMVQVRGAGASAAQWLTGTVVVSHQLVDGGPFGTVEIRFRAALLDAVGLRLPEDGRTALATIEAKGFGFRPIIRAAEGE